MDIQEELQKRRIVTLSEKITWKQADKVRRRLLELDLESDGQIFLLIDSDGGGVQSAFSICDLIPCLKSSVMGVVVGKCFSSAILVLLACDDRLALKHTRFFLHFNTITFTFGCNLSEEEVMALFGQCQREARDWQAKNERFVSAQTGKTVDEIRKLMRNGDVLDAHLNADEAEAIGIINEIIEDPEGLFAGKL